MHPRTHVPVVAIVLQGITAIIIAISGRYEQILNYVVSVDFIFFGLTATCLFVFRRREKAMAPDQNQAKSYRMPGHPWTTLFFVAACWLIVINTFVTYPQNTLMGLGILLAGIPVYFLWRREKP